MTKVKHERKFCTGEFSIHVANCRDWHGCFGHSNVMHLDQESACTGYGAHDKVHTGVLVGTWHLHCTVNKVWGLGEPTIQQILKVARNDDWKGRWKLVAREEYEQKRNNGRTRELIEYTFSR